MTWNLLSLLRPRKSPPRPAARPAARPRLEALEDRLVPATLPPGFSEALVAGGLSGATAMEVAPDGRVFVAQQNGQVRVIQNGTLQATPFVSLTVSSVGERGALGLAFDPNFASNQYVYVYYTATTPTVHNRVSRFTANGNVAAAGSEVALLDLETLNATNHNGGAIHFGPDGKLYVAVGDNNVGSNSQTLNNRLGKMLRLNADGTIPTDNPFYNQATGANRAIWALGLRNPFTFSFQPGTGRMFIADVGQNAFEEFSEGVAGANYGWPAKEGFSGPSDLAYRDPIHAYPHSVGATVIGGPFYNPANGGAATFPAGYLGDYFYGDFVSGRIWTRDEATGTITDFATNVGNYQMVDMKLAADGSLYYLKRGELWRVTYNNGTNLPPVLAPIGNKQIPASQDVLTIPLPASDPNGTTPTRTVTAQSLAYVLDQRLALYTSGNLYVNYGGLNDKWVLGAGSGWYFILPSGELYRWDGTANSATGTFIANVGASYHADPALLYNATPNPRASVTISGTNLVIDRENGFTGSLYVVVTASDGTLADNETFTVTVSAGTNQAPVLAPINNQTIPSSQQTVVVALSASDPNGDPITYSATAQSLAYVLSQQVGTFAYDSQWNNWGGANEKWFLVGGSQWYYLLPTGALFQWSGGGLTGTSVGNVGTSYWSTPALLQSPPANQPRATLSVSGSTLTVTRDLSYVSAIVVTATASDGSLTDSKTFTVTVTG